MHILREMSTKVSPSLKSCQTGSFIMINLRNFISKSFSYQILANILSRKIFYLKDDNKAISVIHAHDIAFLEA